MIFQEEKHGDFTVKIMSDKAGRWTFSICKEGRQIVCGAGLSKTLAHRDALSRLSSEIRTEWDSVEPKP
jgi:hypothetical protein